MAASTTATPPSAPAPAPASTPTAAKKPSNPLPPSSISSDKKRLYTMKKFDMSAFIGTWYGIGHIGDIFNAKCQYTKLDVGRSGDQITLSSECMAAGKSVGKDKGEVRVPDPDNPSKMEIKAGFFRGWIPLWVYETDYTSTAILGNAKGNLWLLSRTPTISFCSAKDLKEQAELRGFDSSRLAVDFSRLTACS